MSVLFADIYALVTAGAGEGGVLFTYTNPLQKVKLVIRWEDERRGFVWSLGIPKYFFIVSGALWLW